MDATFLTGRDDLFVVRNFLDSEECDRLIAISESIGYGEAPISTSAGAVVNKSMRNNNRVMIDDFGEADKLWMKIWDVLPYKGSWFPCSLNERLRFYRYEPGQQFDWHYDGEFRRGEEVSRLTFMVYLSDDCEGGTTDFIFRQGTIRDDEVDLSVIPEKGMLLVFPHNVLHRGAPVISGCKYVLRSDVMYRQSSHKDLSDHEKRTQEKEASGSEANESND